MHTGRFAGLIRFSALGLATVWPGACLPRSDEPYRRQTEDDAGNQDPVNLDAGARDPVRKLPNAPAHAVLSVTPNHGPFKGGQTVLIRGNGFKSDVRIWFGPTRVDSEHLLPVDPSRVQLTVPEGLPGAVDVVAQNGADDSTRAVLPSAYVYDAFYVEPQSGPTSGGTRISLFGASTSWDEDTEVSIDLKPCEDPVVVSETELQCTTPEGSAGSKNVRVTTADGVEVDVLDAFIYGDSESGFVGGLSGQPLQGELSVSVVDNFTGSPIPGASVIAGSSEPAALVETTNSKGVARFSGDNLGPTQTITVAAKCFSPVTFVDVPVDTVNVYLDPVLDISCADFSDIPTLPGTGRSSGSSLRGELLWPSRAEFDRSGWTNVPSPKGTNERLVAYVFRAFNSATQEFRLPSSGAAVTPTADGEVGYDFYLSAVPGNATYYALAGVENRSLNPPLFTAYAMGVASGVTTQPDTTTTDVFIPVDVPLDHTLSLEIHPPQMSARGPDRLEANVVVRLSEAGYALLPVSRQQRLLPGESSFNFVGLPPLVGSLAGAQYVVFSEAVTGAGRTTPSSFGGLFATTDTSQTIVLESFVEVPVLEHPAPGTRWSGERLEVSWPAGGTPVDLVVFEIRSAGGLINWTVAAPGSSQAISLPNLKAISRDGALAAGALSIRVTAASIEDFDYGSLRYRQLSPRGFDAFALDAFAASY
jgi:hypothetical protein